MNGRKTEEEEGESYQREIPKGMDDRRVSQVGTDPKSSYYAKKKGNTETIISAYCLLPLTLIYPLGFSFLGSLSSKIIMKM